MALAVPDLRRASQLSTFSFARMTAFPRIDRDSICLSCSVFSASAAPKKLQPQLLILVAFISCWLSSFWRLNNKIVHDAVQLAVNYAWTGLRCPDYSCLVHCRICATVGATLSSLESKGTLYINCAYFVNAISQSCDAPSLDLLGRFTPG